MAATFAAEAPASERSRDVSDPTRGPRTLTPGSVRGSLTSRLLVTGTAPELGAKVAATTLWFGA